MHDACSIGSSQLKVEEGVVSSLLTLRIAKFVLLGSVQFRSVNDLEQLSQGRDVGLFLENDEHKVSAACGLGGRNQVEESCLAEFGRSHFVNESKQLFVVLGLETGNLEDGFLVTKKIDED